MPGVPCHRHNRNGMAHPAPHSEGSIPLRVVCRSNEEVLAGGYHADRAPPAHVAACCLPVAGGCITTSTSRHILEQGGARDLGGALQRWGRRQGRQGALQETVGRTRGPCLAAVSVRRRRAVPIHSAWLKGTAPAAPPHCGRSGSESQSTLWRERPPGRALSFGARCLCRG